MKNQQSEKGYILVTVVVLLGMLGMIGVTAAWKASVENKVSGLSGKSSQALQAANAGIQKQFYEWTMDAAVGTADGDRSELVALVGHVADNTNPIGAGALIYNQGLVATGLEDLEARMGGDIDAYIQGAGNVRVFNLTAGGIQQVANAQWGTPSVPQVAVWATSFAKTDSPEDFPYKTVNAAAKCDKCALVLYALGSHQGVQRLVRQKVSTIDNKLYGVAAMTNATAGGSYADICDGGAGDATLATGSFNRIWDPTVTGPGGNGSAVIEVTQATYELVNAPSGNALISNTDLGDGKKGFRKDVSSITGALFESTPLLVYSGHGTASGVKVDYADMKHDTVGTDLPPNLLPKALVAAPLMGTDAEIKFFTEPSAQLFSMPTYRWAAEQFTCQTLSWPPAPNPGQDGVNGNGIYCSKGEALRVSLALMGYTPRAPVTGRLTLADFQYNIANNIPMFGMVRVMFPAEPSGKVGACGPLHIIEQPQANNGNADFNKLLSMSGDGVYDGGVANVILDNDGDLGPTARLIVYGSLLVDYFADYPILGGPVGPEQYNAIFDANAGERFLDPIESPDVYLAIEHNIMINPVMPRHGAGQIQPFPTAAQALLGVPTPAAQGSRLNNPQALNVAANRALVAARRINMVDLNRPGDAAQGNRVNLASPYDGYFPWAEGLVPMFAGESPVGTMRLMSLGASGLVTAMSDMQASGAQPVAIPTGKLSTLLSRAKPRLTTDGLKNPGSEANVLEYYYKLMVASISGDAPNAQSWPVAAWPGNNLAGNFYIGEEDKVAGNNDGDKLHLMFPTGYAHGWKVALAALDISADEWNNTLSGGVAFRGIGDVGGLYDQLVANCGGACARGLPMSAADVGFTARAEVFALQQSEDDYFFVTPDVQTGYGLMDSDWKDIPATMYSGGLLDMHAHSNMNGIIYTPGPLEWEPGNSSYDGGVHMSYVTGSIITGYGQYTKNKSASDRYIMVFDKQAVDNITVRNITVILRKHSWQELR